jgi:hypothetical protein
MRISKLSKRILSAVLFAAMLAASELGLSYALEPVSFARWFKSDLRTIEKQGQEADLVIVGGSRTFRSFVPSILEEELGFDCVINGGSALQSLSGSYYQLKELTERFHPKYAVLAVTWNGLTYGIGTQSNLIVLDRLTGLNKLEFIKNGFTDDDRIFALLKSYRFRKNLTAEDLAEIHEDKRILAENKGRPFVKEGDIYSDTGFVYSYESIPQGNVPITHHGIYDWTEIHEDRVEYLDKIVGLCKEKDIKLMLVSAPSTLMQVYNIDSYQMAVDYYEEYAAKNGLIYHNLNYLKDREELLPDTVFMDYNHLNGEGAEALSRVYARILAEDLAGGDTASYFYRDFYELQEKTDRIAAVSASFEPADAEGKYSVQLNSLHGENITPYYALLVKNSDGNLTKISDWSQEENIPTVSAAVGTSIIVRAGTRGDDSEENTAWQEYVID